MKINPKKLAGLQNLTNMMRDARQAKIANIQGKIAQLKGQITEMDEQLQERAKQTGADYARQAGADFLWQKWTDTQKIQINQNMAHQLVALEMERDKLKIDFGKSEAVSKIRKHETAEHKKRLNRQI